MSSQPMGSPVPELLLSSAKILVVDEESADLRFLRLILEGQGLEVSTCTNFDAGVQSLDREKFDFIVLSQGGQTFEGRKVLDRAVQLDRHRPVLVLTRCMDMKCYLEAMQMGAIDYLEKPVPPSELLRFVRTHVQYAHGRAKQSAA